MADNVTITQGAGTDIAADEILSVKYQRIKVTLGADGVNDADVSSSNPMPVSVAAIVPGTGATNLGKAEDAVHASGDVGVMSLSVRKDTAAATSGADGDYQPVITDANGRLHVIEASGAAVAASLSVMDDWDESDRAKVNPIVGQAGVAAGTGVDSAATQRVSLATDIALPAGTNTIGGVAGDIAAAATDSGKPVKIGGYAGVGAYPTAVTNGQRVNALFDKLGKQVVVGSLRTLKTVQATTITSSTSETTIGTAVASTFLDLYGLIITNTSATPTVVTIKDSTAGTTRITFAVPATETRGFMVNESAAHMQATVNNNWTATSSASVASLQISALFVQNL